jgi:hypothetical protein
VDRRAVSPFFDLFAACPTRIAPDGTVLDSPLKWRRFVYSNWREVWEPQIRSVASREGLAITRRGRAKLDAFHASLPPERPADLHARTESFRETFDPFIFGDVEHLAVIARVLALAPTPVSEHFCETSTVIAAGASSGGWSAARLRLPPDRTLVVLARADATLVAHELVHGWLDLDHTGPVVDAYSATAIAQARKALAEQQHPAIRQILIDEVRAELLSAAWLLAPGPTEA